jgi:predicted HicB family RNase H-like nuclease
MPSRLSSRNTPTLTIRLPDDMHERLRALARSNAISVNMLMDKRATFALANFDVRVRFETRAARGNPRRALKLLDKLDRAE